MANHRLVALGGIDGGGWTTFPAASQAMARPTKLAFDNGGRMYIMDTGNTRLLRIDSWDAGFQPANQVTFGTYGDIGTGAVVPPVGMFMNPTTVWVNQSDNTVYVGDTVPTGTYTNITMVDSFKAPSTGMLSWKGFSPAGASAELSIQDIASAPSGDPGFYLCTMGLQEPGSVGYWEVRHYGRMTADAGAPSTSLATTAVWRQAYELAYGCAVDLSSTSYETLYVAGGNPWSVSGGSPLDSLSNVRAKMTPTTGANYGVLPPLVSAVNVFGGMGLDSAPPAMFSGFIYLADKYNHRIIKTEKVLSGVDAFTYGSFGPDAGLLATPNDVKVGPDGRLYIADTNNDRVVRIDNINGTNWSSISSSAGSSQGQFRNPRGVAYGPDGGIYVADTDNHRIVQLSDPSGSSWTEFKGTGLSALVSPTRIKVTAAGIYVLDPGRSQPVLFIADMSGTSPRAWSPNTLSPLNNPQGFDVDPNGHLFIADTGNHRIVEVDDFTPPSFTGGTSEAAYGAQGSNTGQFQSPADLALSPDGLSMVIADTLNNRLVNLAHPASFSALNATGWATLRVGVDFTSAWNRPGGVAFGGDGKIYVTDTSNHRIVRMDDFTGANLVSLGVDGSGAGQFVRPFGIVVR